MISKGAFRHVESELYAYPETKKEIERIRLEILHPYKPTEKMIVNGKLEDVNIVKGTNSVRTVSDPTADTATALATNRKVEQLEMIVDVIESVINSLPEEKKKLMQLWYWSQPRMLTWDGVALRLHVSRRTAINWRNEVVHAIAVRMGWR